jgi:hypothetical protein
MIDETTDSDIILPYQHADKVLLLADRYLRGTQGMSDWVAEAKHCVEMTEGLQWTPEAIAALEASDRKAFQWNKIIALVRLVLGYQRSTKTDIKVLPNWQGYSTSEVADVLTKVIKQLAESSHEPYIDTEVFMLGIITGRGFYDARLNFEKNELGEIAVTASDPFNTILDPDGDSYNLNDLSYIIDDRWASIDEVEITYGKSAAMMLKPLWSGMSGMPLNIMETLQTNAPWRYFGGNKEKLGTRVLENYYLQSYDSARKNVRLLDCQHYVNCRRKFWIDLDTGRKEPVDESWTPEQIQRVLQWSQAKYAEKGKQSPIRVLDRPGKRVRWTTMVGDIIVYDDWSPYESYTKVGYFPWFRQGKTMGMVADLIGPQEAINKQGSAEIDIVARSANSGWKVHDGALREEEKDRLMTEGAAPGYNMFWQGEVEPKRIEPGQPPTALERMQLRNNEELKQISGINDSALGQLDRVQSGVAVEARQRQSVIAIQVYMDNLSRSKELLGRKKIELIQNHYTEERLYRIVGDDGKRSEVTINKRMATGEIINDVTNGEYSLVIDETPLAKTFASAQQEEINRLVEIGILDAKIPVVRNKVIEMSSIPNKEQFLKELDEWQQQQLAALGAGDKKTPEETLTYRDAPEDVRRQIEEKAGLQPSQIGGIPGQPIPVETAVQPASANPLSQFNAGGMPQ